MSASVLKETLALFDKDFQNDQAKKSAKGHGGVKRDGGGTKNLKKAMKQKQQIPAQKKKKKAFKSVIEKCRAQSSVDHTADNVAALQRLTEAAKIRSTTCTEKVFGKQFKLQEPPVAESTVFTDEDFEKFAKEYMPKS